jgi:CDP-4-dehydro-6-deoxyglucose reductase
MISRNTGEVIRKDIILNKYILLDIKSNKDLKYHSGQYISLFINDKTQRSFSVYSPDNSKIISLGIKLEEHGIASDTILNNVVLGDKIDFLGPIGNFYYQNDESDKLVFIATGIGIVPIKGIIDTLLDKKNLKIFLLWGVRSEEDLLFHFTDYRITYRQAISRPKNKLENKRYVQDYINSNIIPFDTNTSFYICGSPENVDVIKYNIKDTFNVDFNKIYTEKF